jgi:hypothetical protein
LRAKRSNPAIEAIADRAPTGQTRREPLEPPTRPKERASRSLDCFASLAMTE